MRQRLNGLRIASVTAVILAGAALGSLDMNSTMADNTSNHSRNQAIAPKPNYPDYPVNENGETFGSGLDAASLEAEPDLIQAYGVDGTVGYVKSKDLIGDVPKTPEEAISMQRRSEQEGGRQIPLYAVDGKTVIGVFQVGPGISKDSSVLEK